MNKYQIALSYAQTNEREEDIAFIAKIAEHLQALKITTFYASDKKI